MEVNKYYTKSAQYLESLLNKLGLVTEHEYQVGRFFIDVYCPELSIGFEFDGPWHKLRKTKDKQREEEINKEGIRLIHITKEELNMKTVKEKLGYDIYEKALN